jgi:hypothetical protein
MLLPAVGTVLVLFVPPLLVSKIINILAAGKEINIHTIGVYIVAIAVLWLLGEIFW